MIFLSLYMLSYVRPDLFSLRLYVMTINSDNFQDIYNFAVDFYALLSMKCISINNPCLPWQFRATA